MTTQHTPGPWQLTTNPMETSDHAASIYGPSSKHGSPLIADISRSPGLLVAELNAKLITAAPDMLEAIQYAITALAGTDGMVDPGELIMDVDNARKRLINAIKQLQP